MMWLIQIDKDRYINGLHVDAVRREEYGDGRTKICVAVCNTWLNVNADFRESFLNHLQACNSNSSANIVDGLTDKVNDGSI